MKLTTIAAVVGIVGTLSTAIVVPGYRAMRSHVADDCRQAAELRRLRAHIRVLEHVTTSEHPEYTETIVWDDDQPYTSASCS